MNLEKLNREITLHCPSCGNIYLESFAGIEDATQIFKCPSCSYEMTKDELIAENSENISININEVKQKAIEEIKKEMQKQLKNAFKNNRNIRIK